MISLPLLLLLFVVLLGALILLVELRVLAYAYRKIGVRPRYVFVLMLLSLLGSGVDIPLYRVAVAGGRPAGEVSTSGRIHAAAQGPVRARTTVIAVNVGGALVPTLLSIFVFLRSAMPVRMLVGVAVVAALVNGMAHIVPGVGIAVPMIVPPLAAAAVALVLAFRQAPPLAYVAGSMGTLIGADLLNLDKIAELGAPVVSIGGAGTFDGVFLTGIIAGLIA